MNIEQLNNKALWIAVAHHLSEWDSNLDPHQLIKEIQDNNTSSFMPWEPFENEDPDCLVDYILSMAGDIVELAKEYKND